MAAAAAETGPRRLAPGIWTAYVPGEVFGFAQGNNVYLLGERDPVLVDTGLPGPECEEVLSALFRAAGIGGPSRLLATHLHRDHCGALPWLRERFGTRLLVHPDDPADAFAALGADEVDEELVDGQRLELDGLEVRVVATPGHSPGHVALHLPDERLLLTGDLVVGSGTSWVGPPSGSLVDYLASLRRVRALPADRLLPAHGPIVDDPTAKIDEYLKHRGDRERQVLEGLAAGRHAVAELVREIYVGYPDGVLPLAALTMRGHLEKLIAEGRVRCDEAAEEPRYFLVG